MADSFDFTNPLQGLDEELEKENSLIGSPDPAEEEERSDKFSFEDPLKGAKPVTGPRPSDFEGSPIGIAAGFISDVVIKPFVGLAEEADVRYPDTQFENTAYVVDAIQGVSLKEQAQKVFTMFKIGSLEERVKFAKGEAQLGGIDYGMTGGYADMYNANLQMEAKDKYKNDPAYKKRVDSTLAEAQKESIQEFKRIDKAIAKKRADQNLGPYGSSVSSAAESIAVIGTGMAINYMSGGTAFPAVTGGTLTYFGLQTAGASYSEAVQQGLPHDTALGYATINGMLEAGTEMVPVMRFLSPRGRGTIKDIFKTDLATVGIDVGMENINSLLQEHNSVWFDLESELKTAYDNQNNPLYEGKSVSEVLVDIAGHTTLSSVLASGSISATRTAGGVVYSQEVKDYIRNQKDNPELELFIENFNNNVNNLQLNYNAIDSVSRILLDPATDGKGWSADEVIALEYFNQPFIDFRKPLVVGEEGEILQENNYTEQLERKFVPKKEKEFSLEDPLNEGFQRKDPGPLTSEINLELSPIITQNVNSNTKLLETDLPDSPTLNIDQIKNDTYDQKEVDLTKSLIIDNRTFEQKFLDEPNSRQKYYRLRDLNEEEGINASKSIIDLTQAGMPIDIFSDLDFMGAHAQDNRYKTLDTAYGVYMPTLKGVSFSPISGISNLEFQNNLGSRLNLRSTMAHEMGHHIDFTIGRPASSDLSILQPATSSSPLFNFPNFKYNKEANTLDVEDGTGGEVMREAFNLFSEGQKGRYYDGNMLRYPFDEMIAMNENITLAAEKMIKAEVFGQLHELYYTNRALLEEKAPTALKLIEELNDAISIDGTTKKNERVQLAFQTPSAQRSVEVSTRDGDLGTDQQGDIIEEPSRRVDGSERLEDGDRVRPEIPELEQVKTTGQVKGAPKGMDSKQKVGALRRKMGGLAKEGVSQRFWYEQSGQSLLDITNNNKEDADKLAQVIAITSPGTPVDANFNYALQAYYQYAAGETVKTGRFPKEMSRKILDVFEGKDWGGRKTNEFYNNIMRVIDPARTQGVTVDVWMVRAFGFDTDAPTPAQYTFVENEIQKITDQLGWEPQQVQAAIWTAQKARSEGTDVNAAGFNYANAVQKSLAQVSWESIPGRTSGHMPEMFNAPYEQVQEYHVAISKALQDENGGDFIANSLGILSPGIVEAPGFFEGKVSPGSQTEIATPKIYKADNKTQYATMEPAAENLVQAYAAALGILLKQDGVGYHRPFVQKGIAKTKLNGMDIDIGRPLTENETQMIAEAMEKESGIKDYNPIGTSTGARLINFSYLNIPNPKFKKIVNNVLDGVQFENNEDVTLGGFASSEGYLSNDWSKDKNGEGYIQNIGRISPDLQGRVENIVRELKQRINEVDQGFSEKYGWSRDESINSNYAGNTDPARKIIPPETKDGEKVVFNDIQIAQLKKFKKSFAPTKKEFDDYLQTIVDYKKRGAYGDFEKGTIFDTKKFRGERVYRVVELGIRRRTLRSPYSPVILAEVIKQTSTNEYAPGVGEVETLFVRDFTQDGVVRTTLQSQIEEDPDAVKIFGKYGDLKAVDDVPTLSKKVVPEESPDFNIYETMTSNDASQLFQAFSTFQENAVDKLDRLKAFEQKFGEFISPEEMRRLSVIRKTDVYHGKVKYGMDNAVKATTEISQFLEENNISREEFNDFLKNLHAPERNAKINEKYNKELPELEARLVAETDKKKQSTLKGQITKRKNVLAKYQDSGSGIKTAKAIEKLNDLGIKFNESTGSATSTNEKGKNLLKAFDLLNAYQNETLKIYKDQDLVDEQTLEDWDKSYKYYVPLVGFSVETIEDSSPRLGGGGISVFGREVMEAKGRTSESGPPLEQAVVRRQSAVVRGEKNFVDKSLAELVNRFPDNKLWQVRGVKRNERPHAWDGAESKIGFKEGGKQKFIVIRDQRLAEGLDAWGNNSMHWTLGVMRGLTGTLSSLYTSLAPEFIVGNFFRDYQTGYFNLLKEQEIEGGRAQGLDLAKAFKPKNIAKTMRQLKDGYVTGKLEQNDPETFALFDAFQKFGGQTGYVNAKDIDQIAKAMETLSLAHQGKGKVNPKKLYNSTFQMVENINNAIENTARFAVFKEYINAAGGAKKASKQDFDDAAVLAKNLTINFNRSGKFGPVVNSLYIFANASVQGSVNMFRGMNPIGFEDGKIKWTGVSKSAKTIMGGLTGLGALVQMYSMLVSDEDEDGRLLIDKIPDHEKERFMIVPIPGVKYKDGKVKFNKYSRRYTVDGKPFALAIPLPYGYNIFYNLGRMGTEVASKPLLGYQKRTPVEMGKDMGGIISGAFSPVGIGYSQDQGVDLIKTIVPSVAKPIYEARVNEKWTGAPVYKEQFPGTTGIPESSRKLKNTNEFYREFTMMINKASGGGKFDKGMADWSPDKMKFYLQAYLGGMYTMAERTASISGKIYNNLTKGTNQDIELNEIPFVRVLTAEPMDYVDASNFYKKKDLISQKAGEYINYAKDKDRSAIRDYVERTGFDKSYLGLNAISKEADSRLRKLGQKEKTILNLREKDYARFSRLSDQIDDERHDLHLRYNRILGNGLAKIEKKKKRD